MRCLTRFASLLFAGLILSGCTVVTTAHPLTSTTARLDRTEFEGHWLLGAGDQDTILSVRFSRDGIGHVGVVEWERERLSLRGGEMIVGARGRPGAPRCLSIRLKTEDGWSSYLLAAYRFADNGDLVLWPPRPEAFRAALESKRLQGEESSGEMVLTSTADELSRFLGDPESGELFKSDSPLVLRRVESRAGSRARAGSMARDLGGADASVREH